MQLFDYQARDVKLIRQAFGEGRRSVLYQAPCGAGKTVMFSYIAEGAMRRGNRTCILVHRKHLVDQTAAMLTKFNIPHGVIQAGKQVNNEPIQVASVQSLIRRLGDWRFDFLITDECHLARAMSYQAVYQAYPEAKHLGVSATPCRMDGRGLAGVYEHIIVGPQPGELIALGRLTRPRVFAPSKPDLKGVKSTAGDYKLDQLAFAVRKSRIVGDAVAQWRKLQPGKRGIGFCVDIQSAKEAAQVFNSNGILAVSVDGGMPYKEIRSALDRLAAGMVSVVFSCNLFNEGLDIPAVDVAINLRPTKSLGLYIQQVGRVMRAAPGKRECIVLDHAGNTERHGLPHQDRAWTLEGDRRPRAGKTEIEQVRMCSQCYFCHDPAPACPECGFVYPVKRKEVEKVNGELVEVTAVEKAIREIESKKEEWEAKTLEDWQRIARARGYKPGWAWHRFNARRKSAWSS